MRRILLLLILQAASLSLISARTPADGLIESHRFWVAEKYADPTSMTDEQLIHESVVIVGNELREPEAVGLLTHTSHIVPGLKPYIKWLACDNPDSLMRDQINALRSLKDYAIMMWPGTIIARRCETAYLTALGNISDTDSDWKILSDSCAQADEFLSQSGAKGLLAMIDAIRLCQRICRSNVDDISDYPEVFRIERDALEAYPPSSNEISLQRAEVYYWIGLLKSMLSNDLAAALQQSVADFNRATRFILVGENGRYPCNSPWYYEKARRIAESVLNPGHPFVRGIVRVHTQFDTNTIACTPQLQDRIADDHQYVTAYYPPNSIVRTSDDCLWYIHCLQKGLESPDEKSLKSNIRILEKTLGTNNPIFRQHLFQLAASACIASPDDYWIKRLTDIYEKSDHDALCDEKLYFSTLMMFHVNAYDPEASRKGMDTILEEYLTRHSSTPLSVLTGITMAQFFLNSAFDHSTGLNLLFTVLADVQSSGTADLSEILCKADYWDIALKIALHPDPTDTEFSEKYITQLIELLDYTNLTGKNLMKYYLKSALAELLATKRSDYAGAAKLYEECIDIMPPTMTGDFLNMLTQVAFYRQIAGEPAADTDPFILRAIDLYKNSDQLSVLPIHLQNIGTHYYNNGDMQKAFEWYDEALGLYKIREGEEAFTPAYMLLRRDMAATLESLGRLAEARAIQGEDADRLSGQSSVNPTPDLLNALWLEYYTLSNDNAADYSVLMPRLQYISDLTNKLYALSGNDITIRNSFLLRCLSQAIYASAINMDDEVHAYIDNNATEQLQGMLQQFGQLIPMLEEWLGEIRESNPNYIADADYRGAVTTLATVYIRYYDNPAHAAELLSELTANDISDLNINDFDNYARALFSAGDMEEATHYVDIIEEALEHLPGNHDSIRDHVDNFRTGQYIRSGEYEKAIPYARHYFKHHKNILDGNFKLMSRTQQDNYMQTFGDPADLLAALLEYQPEELASETYDAVLYRTGMQLRSYRATRDLIEKSGNRELKEMLDSVESIHTAMLGLHAWLPSMSQEENAARIRSLGKMRHQADRIEQRLLFELNLLESGSLQDVAWIQIRDRLKPGEAAVEYLFSHEHILALIIRPGFEAPRTVVLCQVDSLLNKLNSLGARNSAARAKLLYLPDDTDLYTLLWQPMESLLSECDNVYCSTPGILSTLAFNAFPTPYGDVLFDRAKIIQLTTTGQLVFDHPENIPESIAIMGDILYDENQIPLSPDDPRTRAVDEEYDFSMPTTGSDSASRGLKKSHFRHLPFTAIEIDSISLEFDPQTVMSARRTEASETRFREMASGHPDIIHLATHGFYISPYADISAYPFIQARGGGICSDPE